MSHRFSSAAVGAVLLLAWTVSRPTARAADEPRRLRFEDGLRLEPGMTPADYAPRPLVGGSASDTWEWIVQFPHGPRLIVSVRITNLGPGSDHAQFTTAVILPDGSRRDLINNGRPRGEWTLSKDDKGFTLGVVRHSAQITADRHRLTIRAASGSFEIDAVPTAPPYRVGRVVLGPSKFYDLVLVAPRLAVRGVTIEPDGTRRDLGEGTGIMAYTRSNVADYDRALAVFGFHSLDGPSGLSFFEFTEAKTREQLGLLLEVKDRHVSAWPDVVSRRYEGLARETASPRYPLPSAFTLEGTDLTGRASLKLLRRDDLLAEVSSPIFRFFLRQRTHPVLYVFDANYRFSLGRDRNVRVLAGAGVSTLGILNGPPANRPW